jgi:hypothetical protein
MDMTAELNSEQNSSTAAPAANAASPESTEAEVDESERAGPSASAPHNSAEPTATPNGGKGAASAAAARLELISFFEPEQRARTVEAAVAKSPRSFVAPGLAAALALLFLIGAGAVYERTHQTALLASKVQENEHLVSTVSNLTERLDTIEASRAREETADVRKVLGEIKQSASATRDVSAAVTQLASRLDRVEHEQSARLDKLGERVWTNWKRRPLCRLSPHWRRRRRNRLRLLTSAPRLRNSRAVWTSLEIASNTTLRRNSASFRRAWTSWKRTPHRPLSLRPRQRRHRNQRRLP